MIFKNIIMSILISVLILGNGCTEQKNISQEQKIIKNETPYGFDKMGKSKKQSRGISLEDYELAIEKIKELSELPEMEDAIITVNEKEITRKDFETLRIMQNSIYSYSIKETVYSLVRQAALKSQAEKLNIEPSQEKIDEHMNGIHLSLDSTTNGSEYTFAYMKARGYTKEDFLKEQEENAYNIYQSDALYQYMQKNHNFADFEEFVSYVISESEIKILDSEIEKACLEN